MSLTQQQLTMTAIIRGDGIDTCIICEAVDGHAALAAVTPTAVIPKARAAWISVWYRCPRCGYHWTRPWPARHDIAPLPTAAKSSKARTRHLAWQDENQ